MWRFITSLFITILHIWNKAYVICPAISCYWLIDSALYMLVGFYPWDRSAANHISASIFTSSCQLVQMEAEIGLATQDYLLVTTEGRLDLLWSATPVSFVQQKIQCVTVRLVVMMSSCGTASLGLLKFQTIFDCTWDVFTLPVFHVIHALAVVELILRVWPPTHGSGPAVSSSLLS